MLTNSYQIRIQFDHQPVIAIQQERELYEAE